MRRHLYKTVKIQLNAEDDKDKIMPKSLTRGNTPTNMLLPPMEVSDEELKISQGSIPLSPSQRQAEKVDILEQNWLKFKQESQIELID